MNEEKIYFKNGGIVMKKIIVPKQLQELDKTVSKKDVDAYFKVSKETPSIKEQLVYKAFEITKETKVLFETEEVTLLYSKDSTGIYLSCFSKIKEDVLVEVPLSAMSLEGKYKAYCVLTAEELSITDEMLNMQVPSSGVLLVKLTKISK